MTEIETDKIETHLPPSSEPNSLRRRHLVLSIGKEGQLHIQPDPNKILNQKIVHAIYHSRLSETCQPSFQ